MYYLNKNDTILKFYFLHQTRKEGFILDSNVFNLLLAIITFVISVGMGFLVNFLNQKIGSQKLQYYYDLTKQIVMAIEQSNPELTGSDKKELAMSKLLELTHNKITSEQANTLIESSVYEIKKLFHNI